MNTTISKKEIILGLHQDGKNLNEIQAKLMFQDDLITYTEVTLIMLLLEDIFTEFVSNRA